MAACPYNARVFNWNEPRRDPDFNYGDKDVPVRGKGVVEKCTILPTAATSIDPNSEISQLVVKRKAGVLLEEQGTHQILLRAESTKRLPECLRR